MKRHGRHEFIRFLNVIERQTIPAIEGFFATLKKRRLKAASSGPSPTFKPRSTASSKSAISDQGHSLGPAIETKSSRLSCASIP
jgi:hypothetical protein